MRISDWSSDVCSSDLLEELDGKGRIAPRHGCVDRPALERGVDFGEGDRDRLHSERPDEVRIGGAVDPDFQPLEIRWAPDRLPADDEIGRASCRESVCTYV